MVGLAVRTTADGGEAFRIHNNSEYVPLTFHSRKDAIEHMKSLGMDIKATHDPEAEIGLFRALWPLFDNWLPTDYLSHRACVQNPKTSFIQQIPVVYGIYVRGKEYEFRRYLLDWVCSLNSQDRFKLLQVTSPREHEKCYACQLVYNGLRKTCFKMRSVDRAWANANLNVKVSHHSGWLSLCHGLHLLEKSPSRRVWDDVNALWRVMSERFVRERRRWEAARSEGPERRTSHRTLRGPNDSPPTEHRGARTTHLPPKTEVPERLTSDRTSRGPNDSPPTLD